MTTEGDTVVKAQRADELIGHLAARVDRALGDLELGGDLPLLDDPIRFVLSGGGKRLRPVLVLLSGGIWEIDEERIMPAALSVEVFHNFTLVHDDIMDNADERRGRPTVHKKWDEATAILTGDYMLGLAYNLLSEVEGVEVRRLLAPFQRMVRLLCEGQALDKWFETEREVTVAEYFRMIHAKTGALVECAMELGGVVAGASDKDVERLRAVGRHLGRAFQLQDDLLDVVASDARWGKRVGGDLVEGKKTFLVLRALELADGDDRTFFLKLIEENGIDASLIPSARERLERLGVLKETTSLVDHHSDEALTILSQLPDTDARHALERLIDRMRQRRH